MLFSGTPHWTYSKNEQGTAFENNYCIFLLTYLSVYLFVRAEDKLQESVLSFHSEGLGDQIQVVRVCSSCLYCCTVLLAQIQLLTCSFWISEFLGLLSCQGHNICLYKRLSMSLLLKHYKMSKRIVGNSSSGRFNGKDAQFNKYANGQYLLIIIK